jgi:hypothetical protein
MSNKYLIGLINLAANDKNELYNLYVVEADTIAQGFMEYRNTFNLGKFEQPEMLKILPPDTPVGPYTGEKKEEPIKEEEKGFGKIVDDLTIEDLRKYEDAGISILLVKNPLTPEVSEAAAKSDKIIRVYSDINPETIKIARDLIAAAGGNSNE